MLKVLKTFFLFTLTIIFSFSVGFETLILPIVLWVNLSVQHLTSEDVYHYINDFHMNDHDNSNIKRLQPLYALYIQFPKLPVASNFPPSQMKLLFLHSWKKLTKGRRKLKLIQLLEQVYLSVRVFIVNEEVWRNMAQYTTGVTQSWVWTQLCRLLICKAGVKDISGLGQFSSVQSLSQGLGKVRK